MGGLDAKFGLPEQEKCWLKVFENSVRRRKSGPPQKEEMKTGLTMFCPWEPTDWPWGHPASCLVDTRDSFPRVKRPGLEANQSPASDAEITDWSYASTPPTMCNNIAHRAILLLPYYSAAHRHIFVILRVVLFDGTVAVSMLSLQSYSSRPDLFLAVHISDWRRHELSPFRPPILRCWPWCKDWNSITSGSLTSCS